jgi:hypothetical protein
VTVPSPLSRDDVVACGIGLEGKTCCYIFADGTGLQCGKVEDALGVGLMNMGYKRDLRVPTADYPNCQLDTCGTCGGQIHVEDERWWHTRIDDESHEAAP